jgi:syntaxin 16
MKSRNSLPVVDNVQKVLARKLQLLALRQRQMQKTYMIEMQNLKGDTDISGITETERTNTNEALDSLPDETDTFEFAAMERSKEINEMVENLTELGTIFKELNTLVVEQGTVLDRIDYNIEQGVKHTEDAVV